MASIAKDAIPSPDASAIEGDPARPTNAQGFAGGERTQNLVFAVVLTPDVSTINVDGVDRPLTSGMAATVELKTGSRRSDSARAWPELVRGGAPEAGLLLVI